MNLKQKEAQRVTIIGSILDISLGIAKVIVGLIFNSHALVIDGVHSFSDVVTDVFVVVISRYAHDDPDDEHPYGHGRIETLGTFALGSLLFFAAGALAYENVLRIFQQNSFIVPSYPTLIVATISVISKEWIYRYTRDAGIRLKSPLLVANAWHSRSDAFSSVAVVIGIVLAMVGFPRFDAIAALVVAIMIGKIGWDFVKDSVIELADTSADLGKVKQYRDTIKEVYGVRGTHNLRTRHIGHNVIIDVNVEVDDALTVSEGHEIASWVAKVLIEKFEEITDVVVHTDIENDMAAQFSSNRLDLLPLRNTVLSALREKWGDFNIIDQTDHIRLHYKNGKIAPELYFPLSFKDKAPFNQEHFSDKLNNAAADIEWYKRVYLFYY